MSSLSTSIFLSSICLPTYLHHAYLAYSMHALHSQAQFLLYASRPHALLLALAQCGLLSVCFTLKHKLLYQHTACMLLAFGVLVQPFTHTLYLSRPICTLGAHFALIHKLCA
jgi:hypothetical protein